MASGTVLIGLALAILVLGAVAAALFLARAKESGSRLDQVLTETARAREAAQSVDRRFEELRRGMEARVGGVEKRLDTGQQSIAEHLGRSGHILQEVGE